MTKSDIIGEGGFGRVFRDGTLAHKVSDIQGCAFYPHFEWKGYPSCEEYGAIEPSNIRRFLRQGESLSRLKVAQNEMKVYRLMADKGFDFVPKYHGGAILRRKYSERGREFSDYGAIATLDYINGIDMKSWIEGEGYQDINYKKRSLLRALQSVVPLIRKLHSIGLIYCDLKPDNILFDVFGEPHIIDFGSVIRVGENMPLPKSVFVSPYYSAPETFEGHIAPSTDAYSFGPMIYEIMKIGNEGIKRQEKKIAKSPENDPSVVQVMESFKSPQLFCKRLGLKGKEINLFLRLLMSEPRKRKLSKVEKLIDTIATRHEK